MDIDPKTAAVWAIAEPIALELGLELVDIELRREGRGTVLRLLIDKAAAGYAEGMLGDVFFELQEELERDEAPDIC